MSRRSNGVHATNYVLHIPRHFPAMTGTTFCGRECRKVNCIAQKSQIAQGPDVHGICYSCMKSFNGSSS